MDLTQLSQMVAWLDEEHRRDREEIARLDQRLQSMTIENQEQARRIQELEGRLASTQAQLTQFAQIQQALQQLKNEVIVLLDKQTEARLQAERELERARMSDREAFARTMAEIRKELTRLGRIEEELTTRQAEDQRLGEMLLALRQSVNNFSKDLDDRTRTLPYMVEQRAQDNKRIAQLQAEHVELMKRTDALAAKSPALEERISRLERELQKIQPIPDQLRAEQHAFLESQRVADVERTRQMAVWEAEFLQQRELIEKQTGASARRSRPNTKRPAARSRALEEFQAAMIRDQKASRRTTTPGRRAPAQGAGRVAGRKRAALEEGNVALGLQPPGATEDQPETGRPLPTDRKGRGAPPARDRSTLETARTAGHAATPGGAAPARRGRPGAGGTAQARRTIAEASCASSAPPATWITASLLWCWP